MRLPREFRFSGDEVYIKKVGRGVIPIPKDDPWEMFEESLDGFTEDYMEGKRIQPPLEDREKMRPAGAVSSKPGLHDNLWRLCAHLPGQERVQQLVAN